MIGQSVSPEPGEKTSNNAVWLTGNRAAFVVDAAPYTSPRRHEVVVKNKAVAVNPIDWILQPVGDIIFPWLKYPFILGSDVAGEVVEIGPGVSRFQIGDRVLGHAVGGDKTRNSSAEGAFQQFTVLRENMTAPIPDFMTFESAAVLPLGLSTAACGLYEKNELALDYPSANPQPKGKTLLVWGGSTSVGSNAIQLAVASGYDVVTTASPKNFDYVKKLGASQAFDYKSKTVVGDLILALKGKKIVGALAIGAGSADPCLDIVHACQGTKFVSMASPPLSFASAPNPRTLGWLIPTMARMMIGSISQAIKAQMKGIKTHFIFGTSLMDNEISKVIYSDFLPAALADKRYTAAPDPLVVGHGLGSIPVALAAQKKGVSAKKLVVTL